MSRCRHRDRRGYSLVDFYLADGTLAGAFDGCRVFRGVCPRCGTISLGRARDTPATAVEVRAAELAQCRRGAYTTTEAWVGWANHEKDWMPDPVAEQWAGWLAREIWTHEEDDRG